MAGNAQRHGIRRLPGTSTYEFSGHVRGDVYTGRGRTWYVNTQAASGGDGSDWDSAFTTMAAALSAAGTNDTVLFVGDVREELTGSNLVFDLTIVGCGNNP